MLDSYYHELDEIVLPFKGRQLHMCPIDLDIRYPTLAFLNIPIEFEDYFPIIISLLKKTNSLKGEAYLTIDEKFVKKGETQRYPRPHVDGIWFNEIRAHGEPPSRGHYQPTRTIGRYGEPTKELEKRMPMIIASNIQGCRVWEGLFEGIPTERGDCSHIINDNNKGKLLEPNKAYLISGDCIHESLPMQEDSYRTFFRITLPTSINVPKTN